MNKVLAVVAHPDDEIIGPGGALCKHVSQGDSVYVLILGDGKSSRSEKKKIDEKVKKISFEETNKALSVVGVTSFVRESFPDNRFDSVDILDIVKKISNYIRTIKPTIVYTHHFGDLNIDHQITSEATVTACRPIENSCVSTIYQFETLSSSEMGGFTQKNCFLPNVFVEITDFIDKKVNAMACYKSELHDFPHPRSLETIQANAKVWGSKVNVQYAEAFFCLREIK